MSREINGPPPETVLRNYFRAKDENRPHVMERVFEPDAELIVINGASTISFPARTVGREGITDVLVRHFGRTYENVRSFYLRRPTAGAQTFSCPWLVTMSEKQGGSVRVGCGRYDWSFASAAPHLATQLTITIHAMQVLPPDDLAAVLAWVQRLSYPWCAAHELAATAPGIELLAPILQYLAIMKRAPDPGALPAANVQTSHSNGGECDETANESR